MKSLLLLLAIAFSPAHGTAAVPVADSIMLTRLAAWLHASDGFSMTSRIEFYPESDTSQRQVMNMLNYGSDSAFIRYSNSNETELLVCKGGYYKVDKVHRTAFVMQYTSDTSWYPDAQRLKALGVNALVDSYFFKGARLLGQSRYQDVVTYSIAYPEGSPVTRLSLSFGLKDQSIRRAVYRLRRSAGPGVLKDEFIVQDVVIEKYSKRLPPPLIEALGQSSDLKHYLSVRYPGFAIQTI